MNIEDDILIESFLKNELSDIERDLFLKKMEENPSFKKHVELEQQLFDSLDDKQWSYAKNAKHPEVKSYEQIFKSDETHQIKNSIYKAQIAYKKTQESTRKPWLAYIAIASITILFTISISKSTSTNSQELYQTYLENTNLMALVDRGNSNQLSQAQNSFDAKDYKNTIHILTQLIDTTKNANVYVFLAISQVESTEYNKAEKTLNKLISSNLLDAQKGYWYKSLLYLKSEQYIKLKAELNNIISNSYYKKEAAEELLKKIQ